MGSPPLNQDEINEVSTEKRDASESGDEETSAVNPSAVDENELEPKMESKPTETGAEELSPMKNPSNEEGDISAAKEHPADDTDPADQMHQPGGGIVEPDSDEENVYDEKSLEYGADLGEQEDQEQDGFEEEDRVERSDESESDYNDDEEIADDMDTDDTEADIGHRPIYRRAPFLVVLVVLTLSLLGSFGYTLLKRERSGSGNETGHRIAARTTGAAAPETPTDSTQEPPGEDQLPVEAISPEENLPPRFRTKLDEIGNLREELLIKEGEIADLQQHYRKAIYDVQQELLDEKHKSGIQTLNQALEKPSMALLLRTIQRRHAYIESLEAPAANLRLGSEELLFIERKNRINAVAAQACSRIDMENLIADCDAGLNRYSLEPEQLTAHVEEVKNRSLEKLWEELLQLEKKAVVNRISSTDKSDKQVQYIVNKENNEKIWDEICRGQFQRKSDLSELSAEAARCLSKWEESDLFLNGLHQMDPQAARNLFQWEGNWICLNGFRELPPETARFLFQWEGKWISLNGLRQLSFDTSIYLKQWRGKKLELMGLSPEKMQENPLSLKNLVYWEKSGGTLYVSPSIRELMRLVQ